MGSRSPQSPGESDLECLLHTFEKDERLGNFENHFLAFLHFRRYTGRQVS